MAAEVKEQSFFEQQQPPNMQAHEQLLTGQHSQEFDSFAPPPEEPKTSSLRKWFGRGITALAAGGCVAIRFTNYSRWTNTLSNIGTGAFTLASVSWGYKDAVIARIRQVSLTTLGMGTFYLLSQLYANTGAGNWQTFFAHASIGLLGANLQVIIKWLWQKRGVRGESHATSVRGHRMTDLEIITPWQARVLKVIASGGALTGRFLSNDPIVKGLCSFAASYWLTQEAGAYALRSINHQIAKHESADSTDFALTAQGTKWRILKRVSNTVGHIAIPLCFIPWNVRPDSGQRLVQLAYVGIGLGLSSGFTEESERERIKSIPVTELEELANLDAPDKVEDRAKYLAWRAWHIAIPLLTNGGLIGFAAWQLSVLKYRYSQIAIGMTLAGFLGSYWSCKYVDHVWDPSRRHVWRDRAMTNIWVTPRILGMNPLYIYLAGTNAVLMDNKALQSMDTLLPISVVLTSWGMYGIAMGREIYITASDRIGNQLKWPLMLMVNSAITAKLSIAGENNVP